MQTGEPRNAIQSRLGQREFLQHHHGATSRRGGFRIAQQRKRQAQRRSRKCPNEKSVHSASELGQLRARTSKTLQPRQRASGLTEAVNIFIGAAQTFRGVKGTCGGLHRLGEDRVHQQPRRVGCVLCFLKRFIQLPLADFAKVFAVDDAFGERDLGGRRPLHLPVFAHSRQCSITSCIVLLRLASDRLRPGITGVRNVRHAQPMEKETGGRLRRIGQTQRDRFHFVSLREAKFLQSI